MFKESSKYLRCMAEEDVKDMTPACSPDFQEACGDGLNGKCPLQFMALEH